MLAYLPTDGVTFEAVKEQLIILGHDIPDHVIRSFLKDGSTQPAGQVTDKGASAAQHDGRRNIEHQSTGSNQHYTSGNATDVCVRISISNQEGAEGSLDQKIAEAQRQPDRADSSKTTCVFASLTPRMSDVDTMPVSKEPEEPVPRTPSGSPHWPGAPASDLSQEHEAGVTQDHNQTQGTASAFENDSLPRMNTTFRNLDLKEVRTSKARLMFAARSHA